MEVFEATFRREPADSRWASEAAVAVQEALASDEIVQNLLLDIECRSYTCRVEMADDGDRRGEREILWGEMWAMGLLYCICGVVGRPALTHWTPRRTYPPSVEKPPGFSRSGSSSPRP